nr:hypothetical protein [Paenibacillus xylanexedens]
MNLFDLITGVVELSPKIQVIGQLCIGERRYLCILAITLMKRILYIFDESLARIDPEMRYHILKRIEKLAHRHKCTVLVSNHHLQGFANI